MLARFATSLVIALGLLLNGTSARADDEARTVSSPAASASAAARPERQRAYYGWQLLGTDIASLLVGQAISDSGTGALTGMTGYALGAPIIHAIHGNYGTAFASLGLRLGLPVAGGFMGGVVYSIKYEYEDMDVLAYIAVGLVLGATTATLVDSLLLGWTDERAPEPEESRYGLVPQISVGENGVSLGVLGRF